MVRYIKLSMRGPVNIEGLYCTITSVKVFGKSMHLVMRDSLMDLVKRTEKDQDLVNIELSIQNLTDSTGIERESIAHLFQDDLMCLND